MAAALPMVTGSKEVHEIPVTVERYADNPIEADHADSHRLRSMHGRRADKAAQVILAGHAFLLNLRRGHYELTVDIRTAHRAGAAFTELARAI